MDHHPVLLGSVVELIVPAVADGGIVVDGTLGRGGHSRAILEAAPRAQLIGIDRDEVALDASRAYLSAHEERVRFARDDFKNLSSVLERLGVASVRGVLLDLGVSSPQLDDATRGFSFREEGPLDMRMDTSAPLTAEQVVNIYPENELSRVIARYGEERFARRIARAIVAARPVTGTTALAEVVRDAIPAATRRTGGHPARRTFQAIRIEVNDELTALKRALADVVDVLEPAGRAVVLSYHSLEDRIVKNAFNEESRGCICPPDFPVCACGAEARLRVLTRKPVRPTHQEIEANPRASAAKLRAAERLATTAGGPT